MIKKKNGSYYTPRHLSDFIMAYVAPHFEGRTKLTFLEPSCGDGSFLHSFAKTSFPKSIQSYSIQAVEKLKVELAKAKTSVAELRQKNSRYEFVKSDFLKYQTNLNRKFSLIAGNPPYIKKSLLFKTQIALCNDIHKSAGLKDSSIKNIWPYFMIRNCQLLEDDGVLAFVLPAELLQVNFSIELRRYLLTQFQRTEIFTFDDLLFECKGQDTVLLVAYKQHKQPGQYYTHIADIAQLESRDFILAENKGLQSTDTKWTHHLLSADDLTFIHNISDKLPTINTYCEAKPGIVTAGNHFFIVDKKLETEFNLSAFLKPIIQKGLYVNGSIVFDKTEYDNIFDSGKPAKVLSISDQQVKSLPAQLKKYLAFGDSQEFSVGYKCSKRKNWFVIPNIGEPPEGFFFRRVHHYPKILKNEASVLVTDTAYQINMRAGYKMDSLIYSFYNSLSLAFAELCGRYYGGGVLELTPSEFKAIPVLYQNVDNTTFDFFRKAFESKTTIEDILDEYDLKLLKSSLGLNIDDIERIQSIRRKLTLKRFRK